MGRARELWDQFSAALAKSDDEAIRDCYAENGVYLEPNNPPHEGHLLIQAYLNSWIQARENIEVTTERVLESDDGTVLAVEWAISFDAGGRRWNKLPRASWIEVSGDYITHHRDYY